MNLIELVHILAVGLVQGQIVVDILAGGDDIHQMTDPIWICRDQALLMVPYGFICFCEIIPIDGGRVCCGC